MKIYVHCPTHPVLSRSIELPIVPRIGDSIDMFYTPLPKVKDVILNPSPGNFSEESVGCDAVVLVQ